MNNYFNRDEREVLLLLIASRVACQTAREHEKFKVYDENGEELEFGKTADECIGTWVDMILEAQPEDVRMSLRRTAAESRMRIVNRQSVEAREKHILAPLEAIQRLMEGVTMDCMGCMKEGKEINKCQRRRDLLACGCIPAIEEKGTCGFEKGLFEV